MQGLHILFDSASQLPDCICLSENYPIDETIVLSNIKLSSFDSIIGKAMEILSRGIENNGDIFKE